MKQSLRVPFIALANIKFGLAIPVFALFRRAILALANKFTCVLNVCACYSMPFMARPES